MPKVCLRGDHRLCQGDSPNHSNTQVEPCIHCTLVLVCERVVGGDSLNCFYASRRFFFIGKLNTISGCFKPIVFLTFFFLPYLVLFLSLIQCLNGLQAELGVVELFWPLPPKCCGYRPVPPHRSLWPVWEIQSVHQCKLVLTCCSQQVQSQSNTDTQGSLPDFKNSSPIG